MLRQYTRAPISIKDQVQIDLDKQGEVHMVPDILIRRKGTSILVADCKYKQLNLDEFKNHDLYQILAYCTVEKIPRGLLLYPQHEVGWSGKLHIRNSSTIVYQETIDLSKEGDDFLNECQRVARAVTRYTYS